MGNNKSVQKLQQLSKKHQLILLKFLGTQDVFPFLFAYLCVRTETPCDKSAYCHEYRSLIVQRGTYFQPPNYKTTHLNVLLLS